MKRPISQRIILLILDIYIQIFFFSICVGYSFTLHLQLTSVMHKLINNHVSNEHYCTNSFTFYLETFDLFDCLLLSYLRTLIFCYFFFLNYMLSKIDEKSGNLLFGWNFFHIRILINIWYSYIDKDNSIISVW